MEITDLRTFIVGNPWKNWVFCKLYTDEGTTGLGEATGGLHTLPDEAALQEMKNLCLGADPLNLPALRDKIIKSLYFPEKGAVNHALSAIDVACWDIIGKKYDLPLYKLLGGKAKPKLRVYANGWYRGDRTPEFFVKKAKEVVAKGYTALKFDPFGKNYKRLSFSEQKLSLKIIEAVRETVGEEIDLLIEAHDRFSVTTAVTLGKKLEKYNPMWLETPVISTDINATNKVAEQINVPVAVGERFGSLRQFVELLTNKAIDIVQPEFLGLGGLTPLQQVFDLAAAFEADVAPHNAQSPLCTAVNVHTGINKRNSLIQECFDEFQDQGLQQVLSGVPEVKDGYITPNEKPGLGVRLNENKAKEYPYSSDNFLRLFEEGWEKRGSKN